ncbi:hypothetical protein SUGI_0459370 [Cryptomeria japonica]|nr:hypothetical protein SUGI_0459370 [Cryptomeria japonica]
MLLHTRTHGAVVVRFVICVCFVGFTAAKCVPERCGSMKVSYPFWIKNSDCGYPGFNITCMKDESSGIMIPFLPAYNGNSSTSLTLTYYKIMKIDYMGYLNIDSTSLRAWSCKNDTANLQVFQLPPHGPFAISKSNKFVIVGCYAVGTYKYLKWGEARCVSTCYLRHPQVDPPYCRYGCREITLRDNWKWFNFTGGGSFSLNGSDECGFSTILDPSTFKVVDNKTNVFWGEDRKPEYGLNLNWGINLQNCSMAKATVNYSCSANVECIDSPSGKGHVCKCLPGYEGNGYSNGTDCIDIDECRKKDLNKCVQASKGGECHYLAGSYNCSCTKGYTGDGFKNGSTCESLKKSDKTIMLAAIGSISAFVGASLGVCGLVWLVRKRYLKHTRDEFFRCNGGFLLERILAEKGKQMEGKKFRKFSENELKSASRGYSNDMKLGTGGSSTVYKGILSNGTPVAIKKFKEIPIGVESEESVNQFINEMVILSSLNHKNVVNLVGCCLQTQSPLLVYEFVDGGTISHQLCSGTLTNKSDVYSFGVILAELLTGREPLSPGRSPQEIVLSKLFLAKCKENCLTDILDPNVKNEEDQDQMSAVAGIDRECLCLEGSGRPCMREVKMKLEEIGGSTRFTTSISSSNLVNHQITIATESRSVNSLFQLTEMSRMHGR